MKNSPVVPPPPLLLLVLALAVIPYHVLSLPLTTESRWILDAASGNRVKLKCVNWSGHLEAVIPEGLNHKPVDDVAAKVAALGFNCVRLTWSIDMVTKPEYRNLTVSESLSSLGLNDAVAGVKKNNPSVLNGTVIEAFDAVVRALGRAGVMVILDNHVSKPMWCCAMDDGNGFFGDRYFDPDKWQEGLQTMARRYIDVPEVVGMSMRNELRGPNSSSHSWYKHMAAGATTIHRTNPDVLIIVSGLNYDSDLSFLRDRSFPVRNSKILYEAHWYVFSEGRQSEWKNGSLNWLCSGMSQRFDYRIGYINHRQVAEAPLFLSEFGYDQRRVDPVGNKFMNCFMAFAARTDVDWALWALQGSYYIREGRVGSEDPFGVLDAAWDHPKDPDFMKRFRLIQDIIQDPESDGPAHQIIYHPSTGTCLSADEDNNGVRMVDCANRSRWRHKGDGTPIQLVGAELCLELEGDGMPVTLSAKCANGTMWKAASSGSFQVAGVDDNGRTLCMDWNATDSSAVPITKECLCLKGRYCPSDDTETQWFIVITSIAD